MTARQVLRVTILPDRKQAALQFGLHANQPMRRAISVNSQNHESKRTS